MSHCLGFPWLLYYEFKWQPWLPTRNCRGSASQHINAMNAMAKRAPHSASIWLDWLGLHHQNYNILQLRTLATNLEHVPHWDIGHQIQAEFIIFDLTRVLIFRNSKAIQLRLQDISRLGLEVPSRIFCRVSLRFHRYLNHCVASQVKNEGGYTAYELSLRGGETGAQFPDDPRWLDLALQETMGNHGKAPFIGGKASAQFPSFPQSFFLKKKHPEFHEKNGEDGDFRTCFRRSPADRTSKCGKFNQQVSRHIPRLGFTKSGTPWYTLYTLIWDEVKWPPVMVNHWDCFHDLLMFTKFTTWHQLEIIHEVGSHSIQLIGQVTKQSTHYHHHFARKARARSSHTWQKNLPSHNRKTWMPFAPANDAWRMWRMQTDAARSFVISPGPGNPGNQGTQGDPGPVAEGDLPRN